MANNQAQPAGNSTSTKSDQTQALINDKAFIDRVAERVYQLLLADLRREQERRGGRK